MKTNNHNHITWMLSAFSCVVMTMAGCYDDTQLREQVNNQQAELNAALQELRSVDAELDGLVSAVAARVTELEATVEGIETSVGNLGTDVDNLETEVGGIKTDVEGLKTDINGLETGLEGMGADLSEIENTISELKARLLQLENSVPDAGNTGGGSDEGDSGEPDGDPSGGGNNAGDSGNSGDDSNYAEQIAAMQKELADLKSAIENLSAMDSKLNTNMSGLSELLNSHDYELNLVKQQLADYETFKAEYNELKTQIQTELGLIKADIASVRQTLEELKTADSDLGSLITALSSRAGALEAELEALKNTKPDNSRVEALEARAAEIESELNEIDAALTALQDKDTELGEAIDALTAIVNANKAEAESAFADIDKFNALQEEVATLKTDVATLETDIASEFGLVKTEIENIKYILNGLNETSGVLSATLDDVRSYAGDIEARLETLGTTVTENYSDLISRLTAANEAIDALEAKDVQINAAIAALEASLNAHAESAETAYTQHLEAFESLSEEVAAMKLQYEAEFALIKSDIAEIVAMIQSMSFISHYNDGAATALCFLDGTQNVGTVEFNYIVRPAGTAERLAQAWQEAQTKDMLQIRAHYTVTRASFDLFDMPVARVEADGDILTVIAEAEGVTDAFVNGGETLSASLLVTDGRTDYCTDFVNVVSSAIPDLSANGSANSYIVSESGVYRFRTVKGNSNDIVGGEKDDDYNVKGTPATADVYWETFGTDVMPNEGDLIKQVSYKDGYVMFRTADVFREGNALIVVKGEGGGILWSWHIWMTDVPQEQVYYNNAGVLMDRNLGATSATPGDLGAHGLFYQWGRKDPFLGISANVDGTTTACKATGFWPGTYEVTVASTISSTFIAPTLFITSKTESGTSNDWFGQEDKDPDGISDVRWTGADMDKSIYDPCPPGWRVPEWNVWDKAREGSTLTGTEMGDNVNLGMNFKGYFGDDDIWYPCSGEMSYSAGEIRGGGVWCRMWSASANPNQLKSFLLYFSPGTGTISMPYMERAHGYPVRCMKGE